MALFLVSCPDGARKKPSVSHLFFITKIEAEHLFNPADIYNHDKEALIKEKVVDAARDLEDHLQQ